MITGVCLNPCIDRMIVIDTFKYGGTNRIISSKDCPGGKGYNVARAVGRLGLKSAATGFLFKKNQGEISEALEKDNVELHSIILPGSVRVNIKVYEKNNSVVTELNEKGNTIDQTACGLLAERIKELSWKSEYMIFSGSVSPGMSINTYQELIEIIKNSPCRAILDAEGELLQRGIKAKPFMIKPNLYELELLIGRKLKDLSEIRASAEELIGMGIDIVAVSLGEQGAMIIDKNNALYAPAAKVKVKSTVGAGDCMIAGMLRGLKNRKPLDEILKLGVASAASSLIQEGTALIDTVAMEEIYSSISVRPI